MKAILSIFLSAFLLMPSLSQAQEVSVGIQSNQVQGVVNNMKREVQGVRAYVEGALNRVTACGKLSQFYDADVAGDGCVPLWNLNGNETYFSNNVGIGVTNPSARLDIGGDLSVSSDISTGGSLDFSGSGPHITSSSDLILGSNMLTVGATGVTIGGDVHSSGFYYSSDAGLKRDFLPLDGLKIINSLNGFSFNWRESDQEDIGIVAQDVEKVLPQLVRMDAEGNRKVDYSRLVAPLIEAVKQLSQRVEELESAQAE